jgi:hypothetical protein
MSHNPKILSELQKQLLESQKDGFNTCLKMIKMFRDTLIGKATEEQLTPLNAVIYQLEEAEKEIYDVKQS